MHEAIGKRVVKNTIMLYIRMIFVVCINLYISRIILEVLGIEDYGIYNVVGGVVLMLGFLNSTMAGCTSRFLTYELGLNDADKLRNTFSAALYVHIIVALVAFVLGETLGLWLINTQIVIPESRVFAANIVYQFSLLSAVISFIQVPYSADVIAHEKMNVYAIIEIFNVLLKMGVVFIVANTIFDKLMVYSLLLTIVGGIIFIVYFFFCRRNFEEAKCTSTFDKGIVIPMLKFSGWDLYGNGCVIIQQQGSNILINQFWGVALNTATGVASQASSAVALFVSSLIMALRPTIIKKYAANDIPGMQNILIVAIALCMNLIGIVAIPLYIKIEPIMKIWLNDVPEYAVSFCRWMLLANSFGIISSLFTSIIHATGRIKALSLIGGTLYILTLPIIYLLFKYVGRPELAYTVLFVMVVFSLFCNILITKNLVPTLSIKLITRKIIPVISCLIITLLFLLLINPHVPDSLLGCVMMFVLAIIVSSVTLYISWIGPSYGWNLLKIYSNLKKMIS